MPPTVFNIGNAKNNGETLFLPDSQGLSIQRYDQPRYQHLLKLLETGLGFYWLPEEIRMDADKIAFTKLTPAEKHVVISNIKSQVLLDSIMGRAPIMVFGSAINDPTLEMLVTLWTFQEAVHSKSYTYIIQNSFDNPTEVLSTIMDLDPIIQRTQTITEYYDDCIEKIGLYYDGKCSKYEVCVAIYLSLHGANALESIRFPVSFACSFAFGEMGILPGLANVIRLINRDESFHVGITNYLLKILPSNDPVFAEVFRDEEANKKVRALWKQTYQEELEWADYLFAEGDVIGLNANVIKQYLTYVATNRLRAINIGAPEDVLGVPSVTNNPIVWVNKWLSNEDDQPAPQEAELTSYEKGVIDMSSGLDGVRFVEDIK